MDRWHSHILENQKRGDNSLMNEKVLQGIKNAVRTYVSLYQNPNEQRINAFSHDLFETGHSPEQIRAALEDIKNTEDKIASIAQVRQVLGLKFGRSRDKTNEHYNNIKKIIESQVERFKNQRANFVKNTSEEYLEKYVRHYMSGVFEGVPFGDLGIDTWARVALDDFYTAECDVNRAIEIGKRRANKESEERGEHDWSVKNGYRKQCQTNC
jgi:hypothetical protein